MYEEKKAYREAKNHLREVSIYGKSEKWRWRLPQGSARFAIR